MPLCPTPTPWLDTGIFVENAEGGVIASVNEGEDRRFIVRACNAHDELVEVLSKICSEFAQQHPLIVRGREALAKATT